MSHDLMTTLALTFPTLHQAPGVQPWKPAKLDQWACSPHPCCGARHAARFVLAVWNDHQNWRCGRFHLIEAMHTWDQAHVGALCRWLSAPRFP